MSDTSTTPDPIAASNTFLANLHADFADYSAKRTTRKQKDAEAAQARLDATHAASKVLSSKAAAHKAIDATYQTDAADTPAV